MSLKSETHIIEFDLSAGMTFPNKTLNLRIIFSDEKSFVFSALLYPHVSPTLEGTVIHNHIKYCNLNNLDVSNPDNVLCPPLRLNFMSSVFPHILMLMRDGMLLTPSESHLYDVHAAVQYLSGSNAMWIDFATYLSKPLLTFGIQFIPDPNLVVSHEECERLIQHPFFAKAPPFTTNDFLKYNIGWIAEAVSVCDYHMGPMTKLPASQFTFEVKNPNLAKSLQMTSQHIRRLMLNSDPTIPGFMSCLAITYAYDIPITSPKYGSRSHFQYLLLRDWLMDVDILYKGSKNAPLTNYERFQKLINELGIPVSEQHRH